LSKRIGPTKTNPQATFKVCREIDFCYGHRLLNYEGKCRFLHGHNARVEIEISSLKIDGRGMVVDFNDMKQKLQTWIDSTLDHKLLLNRADPLIPNLNPEREPFILMDANPTAEAIAKLIFDHAQKEGFAVTEVRLWETPSSFATYRAS